MRHENAVITFKKIRNDQKARLHSMAESKINRQQSLLTNYKISERAAEAARTRYRTRTSHDNMMAKDEVSPRTAMIDQHALVNRLSQPKDCGENDPKCDTVAESLFRIHNKVNQTRQKRSTFMLERQKALSDHHSMLSSRSQQMSSLDEAKNQKNVESNIMKAQKIEKMLKKKDFINQNKSFTLIQKNLERFEQQKAAYSARKTEFNAFKSGIGKRFKEHSNKFASAK